MTMNIISEAQHEPATNRIETAEPMRFYSTPPTIGADKRRHPVDPGGFEAIAGFQIAPAAPLQEPEMRAISELTYGPPESALMAALPEASSNRHPITDTTQYPWRANALLRITVPGFNVKFQATGWFVGPYAVITAAHAVYPRQAGGFTGWVAMVEVIPALNGFPNNPPFGTITSNVFQCPVGWQQIGDSRMDYGVVLLKQDLGSTVGTYGFATYPPDDLSSAIANLSGYPVVSPDLTQPQGRQWYGAGNVANVDDSFLYYDLGTRQGDSGSCVYRIIGDQSYAMAIHTADNGTNRGIRITAPVHKNLTSWKGMHG